MGAGGEGAIDLAKAVVAASEAGDIQFKFLYPPELSIKEKLHKIVTEMYGVSQHRTLARPVDTISTNAHRCSGGIGGTAQAISLESGERPSCWPSIASSSAVARC